MPAGPMDRKWAERASDLQFNALPRVQATAEKWGKTIASLTGVFGIIALVKGPVDIVGLTADFRVWVGILLAGTLVAAFLATLFAALAAQGTPERAYLNAATIKELFRRETEVAAKQLMRSRLLAVFATATLGVAIGLTWFGPREKTPPQAGPVVRIADETIARLASVLSKPIDVRVTSSPPPSLPGGGLMGLLAEVAAEAIRNAWSPVRKVDELSAGAAQEFVRGLTGGAGHEAGKKLVDGFAELIGKLFASGFKPSPDKFQDIQIIRAFIYNEIVSVPKQGCPPPVARMEERIVFEIDKASLTLEAYAQIGHIRDFAAAHPRSVILLKANADTLGSVRHNQQLARRRSAGVRAALVSAGGIAPNRVFSTDLGNDSLPRVTPPRTAEQRNRSVSIEVRD